MRFFKSKAIDPPSDHKEDLLVWWKKASYHLWLIRRSRTLELDAAIKEFSEFDVQGQHHALWQKLEALLRLVDARVSSSLNSNKKDGRIKEVIMLQQWLYAQYNDKEAFLAYSTSVAAWYEHLGKGDSHLETDEEKSSDGEMSTDEDSSTLTCGQ